MKKIISIFGTIAFTCLASNQAIGQVNKLEPTGQAGVGTDNPQALFHVQNTDATASYPTVTSRGDVLQFNEALNNSFEIGVAGGSNTRKSWLLSRHSSTFGSFGKYYSTMHFQPDVGDKSLYRGVAIGFKPHSSLTIGTHLAVNGRVGIGMLDPSHELSVGIRNTYAPTSTFSAIIKTGLLIGNTANASTLYLYNGGAAGGLHGINAYNYQTNQYLDLYVGWGDKNVILAKDNGNVGIGTVNTHGYKLAVDGSVICEELKVELSNNWPDYVFGTKHNLKPLNELEDFIKTNKHLPNVPSAQEVAEEGLEVGEMLRIQMEKIEELTLYILEQEKRINQLEKSSTESK